MPYNESDSVSTATGARPTCGVFSVQRWPPTYLDTPPDEFPAEDREDSSLRLWFVDEDEEAGRIGNGLELEYEGRFSADIETAIDDAVADTDAEPVDFNTLSVRLYTEVDLRRLVHVTL